MILREANLVLCREQMRWNQLTRVSFSDSILRLWFGRILRDIRGLPQHDRALG